MDRIKCKACGTYSMLPLDVIVEDSDDFQAMMGADQESQFYSCHVCGDNWLSIRETANSGRARLMFMHQMGMSPTLKRIAHLTEDDRGHTEVDHWEFFLGDEVVHEEEWEEALDERRSILRSVCSN